MASSVASERVFSAGGITINKLCNCLWEDVVEALQILKFTLRNSDDNVWEQHTLATEESLEEEQAHEDDTMKGIGNTTSDWLLDADCFIDGDDVLDDTFM
ncbi:uncharacterized protein EV420DRAFT_1652219 [Desarmillaria tabescens]|uniref:HAT C-terminal dimerisation domain-containing protein n=1 Tax=Armillaria tabescens TaxID=1929756 RepID=A0AA39J6N0_ARMTA|nr:uncharacterized protein EV420DRAFT_1652219 [Desarmillaria tabescens]KAK0437091.1 hypothetical protein EV420DRAFT_1652219 [Desarmillaria tabescens]